MRKFEMPIDHASIGNLANARDKIVRAFYGIELIGENGWDAVCYITFDGRIVFVSSKAAGPSITDAGVNPGASIFILQEDPRFPTTQVSEFAENAEFVYLAEGGSYAALMADLRAVDADRPDAGLSTFFEKHKDNLELAINGRKVH